MGTDANEPVVFPEDLSALGSEELAALHARALAEFEALSQTPDDQLDDAGVDRLEQVVAGLEQITTLQTQRTATRGRAAGLRERGGKLRPAETTAGRGGKGGGQSDGDDGGGSDVAATDSTAPDAEPNAESEPDTDTETAARPRRRAGSLAVAQSRAPVVPDRSAGSQLVITAAAPTSGIQQGTQFTDFEALVAATQNHARGMPITRGQPGWQPVATISNQFDFVADQNTRPGEIDDWLRAIRTPDQLDSLVAAGGWCAPPETRYDFFNVACEDGMVDLPTFGVTRGGITFPTSPSLADVFTGTFTNATNPWLWTEADDVLAVTGSPTKPCVRVPCPAFDTVMLECYGICLTAGNLTDSAYPEATRNFLRLLMSAHYHAMNQRFIQQMVALSTAAISVPTGACRAISTDLPDMIGLAAVDYRDRFGMCDSDVLEVVLPRWARDAIRSDISRRTGIDPRSVSDADINRMFTDRRVRIQWVSDWQVRTAGQPGGATSLTAWPDTVSFMIYAAGTFVRGNGLSLDLGVVRDSVLNETNDHTAAWSEECHLIARYGHQSRLYTLPVCVGGLTGGTCTECHVA